MNISDISLPVIYKESADFRVFCKWFEGSLSKTQYNIENFFDLYDPLRCPESLIWALADTMGFKYDDRLPTAFNRLVLLYFMSMIRHRGSKDGVTLAAETNLAQYNILTKAKNDNVLYNRLEDTSIPINSVYVTPYVSQGYIDVVYFSTNIPVDVCLEYVRPVGMYMFQHAGVRFDARTKVSVDARLTDTRDVGMSFGPTQVGHYRREDYARMQKTIEPTVNDTTHTRNYVWDNNSVAEGALDPTMNPGYRALYSLQLCNNEELVKALIDPVFSLGYGPEVEVTYPDSYLKYPFVAVDVPKWNLRYDRTLDETITPKVNDDYDVETVDTTREQSILNPRPAINPPMFNVGDSIAMSGLNTVYTVVDDTGHIGTTGD